MEDIITELCIELKECKSFMVILQQAIQNEGRDTTMSDIDNSLDVLIEKINKAIKKKKIIYNNTAS